MESSASSADWNIPFFAITALASKFLSFFMGEGLGESGDSSSEGPA